MIRPAERDDLPAIAQLHADYLPGDPAATRQGLIGFFARTMFEDPNADEELPSLVFEDRRDGVVGMIASHVRRFGDGRRTLRLACSGPLLARPDHQRRGVGALLLRRYLAGPQDLTATDGAIDDVHTMWRRLGGTTHATASLGWARTLAPAGVAAAALARRASQRETAPGTGLLAKLDAPLTRRLSPAPQEGATEPLTSAALLDLLPRLRRQFPVLPAYDEAYLAWLFRELEVTWLGGRLVRRLVRAADGRAAGAYVYVAVPHGWAHVLAVAAVEDDVPLLMDHLAHDAAQRGCVELRGRYEPHLLAYLRARRTRAVQAPWTLVHARDPADLGALLGGRLLFTRLDGEWWMRPHASEPAQAPASALGARRRLTVSPAPAAPS